MKTIAYLSKESIKKERMRIDNDGQKERTKRQWKNKILKFKK